MSSFWNIHDANNEEYCVVMLENVDEVLDEEIQPIETFAKYESVTDFKGFEALHNIVLGIADQLLCSDVQMEVGQMYDELWWSFGDVSAKC